MVKQNLKIFSINEFILKKYTFMKNVKNIQRFEQNILLNLVFLYFRLISAV